MLFCSNIDNNGGKAMYIHTNSKAIALRTHNYSAGAGIGKLGLEIWLDIASIGSFCLRLKRLMLIRYSKLDSKGNKLATGVSIPLW